MTCCSRYQKLFQIELYSHHAQSAMCKKSKQEFLGDKDVRKHQKHLYQYIFLKLNYI